MSEVQIIEEAKASPYYSVNTMKRIVCRLCNAMCRDSANFLVHLQGKKHLLNAEKAQKKRRLAQLREQRNTAEMAARNGAAAGGAGASGAGGLSAAAIAAPFGEPAYKVRFEQIPDVAATKVWVEAHFPKAAEETRPMHRWVSAYEQTVEKPEPGVVYLLLACHEYSTIALKFPADFPRTNDRDTAHGKFECRWDDKQKVFNLFFIIG